MGIVVADLSDKLKEQIKQNIPNDPTKTIGLYSVCAVYVAAKYDLTTNVSVVGGMTNGAECTIEKIIIECLTPLDQVSFGCHFKNLQLVTIIAGNNRTYIMLK